MVYIKVRYFGRIRELLNVKMEEYNVSLETRVMDLLLSLIPERHHEVAEDWIAVMFRKVKDELALNKDGTPVVKNHLVLINAKTQKLTYKLKSGDEISILPPFGGG